MSRHLIIKKIAFVHNLGLQEILNICLRCYAENELAEEVKYSLFHIQHVNFEVDPNNLFTVQFCNTRNWCIICKTTSLVNVYNEDECFKNFACREHLISNVELRCTFRDNIICNYTWYESIDESPISLIFLFKKEKNKNLHLSLSCKL